MWTHAIVKGSTEKHPGTWGDSTKIDYTCYVCYSSIKDNEKLIKNYFLYYCGFDYDKLRLLERPPLDDYNCLCAIVTYYFRDKGLKFEYKSHEYSRHDKFPDRKPEKESDEYKVWVDVLKTEEVTTPKSAAWMLYEAVRNDKISVEDAKNLVRDEYPEHLHAWDEIMSEFRKYGGAHTKKYLRRMS